MIALTSLCLLATLVRCQSDQRTHLETVGSDVTVGKIECEPLEKFTTQVCAPNGKTPASVLRLTSAVLVVSNKRKRRIQRSPLRRRLILLT